jgi:hypothetical protein
MARTKFAKKKRTRTKPSTITPKRQRGIASDGKANIPPYCLGDIIKRDALPDKLVIIVDHKSGSPKEKVFQLMNLQANITYYDVWKTPLELWLFDYKIIGHMKDEDMPDKEKKEEKTPTGKCPEQPLEDCEIVKGKNPLKRGTDVHFKGSRVVGLRVLCPVCKRMVGVKLSKRTKEYFAVKHNTWAKNVEADEHIAEGRDIQEERKVKRRRTK